MLLTGILMKGSQNGAFLLSLADGQDLDETVANGLTCTGTLTFNTDGSISETFDSESPSMVGATWWSPIGLAPSSGHYVRLNFTSGTNQVTSGAVGSWLEITTARSWTFSKAADPGGDPDSTNGVYDLLFSDDGVSAIDSATLDNVTLTEAAA